jgi:hypothetical protein
LGAELKEEDSPREYFSNNGRLNSLYAEQSNDYARNAVDEIALNFHPVPSKAEVPDEAAVGKLQRNWIDVNSLSNETSTKQQAGRINLSASAKQDLGRGQADFESLSKDEKGSPAAATQGLSQLNDGLELQRDSTVDRLNRFQQRLDEQHAATESLGDENAALRNGRGGVGGQYAYDAADPIVAGVVIAGEDARLSGMVGNMAAGVTPVAASGLASLDIELPRRGREYLFMTPRGEIEITGRSISAASIERAWRFAFVLVACFVIAMLYRACNKLGIDRILSRVVCVLLCVTGLVLFVAGGAPVVALTVVLVGILQFLRLTALQVWSRWTAYSATA